MRRKLILLTCSMEVQRPSESVGGLRLDRLPKDTLSACSRLDSSEVSDMGPASAGDDL